MRDIPPHVLAEETKGKEVDVLAVLKDDALANLVGDSYRLIALSQESGHPEFRRIGINVQYWLMTIQDYPPEYSLSHSWVELADRFVSKELKKIGISGLPQPLQRDTLHRDLLVATHSDVGRIVAIEYFKLCQVIRCCSKHFRSQQPQFPREEQVGMVHALLMNLMAHAMKQILDMTTDRQRRWVELKKAHPLLLASTDILTEEFSLDEAYDALL